VQCAGQYQHSRLWVSQPKSVYTSSAETRLLFLWKERCIFNHQGVLFTFIIYWLGPPFFTVVIRIHASNLLKVHTKMVVRPKLVIYRSQVQAFYQLSYPGPLNMKKLGSQIKAYPVCSCWGECLADIPHKNPSVIATWTATNKRSVSISQIMVYTYIKTGPQCKAPQLYWTDGKILRSSLCVLLKDWNHSVMSEEAHWCGVINRGRQRDKPMYMYAQLARGTVYHLRIQRASRTISDILNLSRSVWKDIHIISPPQESTWR